ncbi:MAG: flagellar motor protein MotB [Pseudomonadota bacterium]
MANTPTPIIVKKIKKGGAGAHGGAWKLAYADFVTAMMAFFLLLWLLGSSDQSLLRGISEYFKDPVSFATTGGQDMGSRDSFLPGGGDDLTKHEGEVKMTNKGQDTEAAIANEQDTGEYQEANERKQLATLKKEIEKLMESNPLLHQVANQLEIKIIDEGLRIQLVDAEKRPMFQSGSSRMEPYAAQILNTLVPLVNELPNKISVTGHTDAVNYSSFAGRFGYSNWELSADRANAARKQLFSAGLNPDKMMRVIGLADSVSLDEANPKGYTNRRIAIIVMNKKTENSIRSNVGNIIFTGPKTPLKSTDIPAPFGSGSDPEATPVQKPEGSAKPHQGPPPATFKIGHGEEKPAEKIAEKPAIKSKPASSSH